MLEPLDTTDWPLLDREEMVFCRTKSLVETELLSKAFWTAHPQDAIIKLRDISNRRQDPLAGLSSQYIDFLDKGCNQQSADVSPDCILVLGHLLSENGSPSDQMLARLDASLECLKRNPNALIIVSGGLPRKEVTEAKAMADWLVGKDVHKSSIFIEEASTDTVDNIVMSTKILKILNAYSVKLITCKNHMPRALALLSIHIAMSNSQIKIVDTQSSHDFMSASIDEKFWLMKDIGRLTKFWSYRL